MLISLVHIFVSSYVLKKVPPPSPLLQSPGAAKQPDHSINDVLLFSNPQ